MATTRDTALVGTDLLLQIKFQATATYTYFDPYSITSVQILDTDGVTVLQTITGSNIVQVQTGIYEVTGLAANYDSAGTYYDRWTVVVNEGEAATVYTLQTAVAATSLVSSYLTVQEMRDQGFTVTAYPNDQVADAIDVATQYIDVMTGRWFAPRAFPESSPFIVDGSGTHVLELPIPIISISKIEVTSRVDGSTLYEVGLDTVMVYTRHLRGQVTGTMDDRENPRIELLHTTRREMRLYDDQDGKWPEGSGNVQLSGYFGYTDYDPSNVRGKTPRLIKRACALLTVRELPKLSQTHKRDTLRHRFRISSQETKDQSFSVTSSAQLVGRGMFTGDPEIDSILTMNMRASYVGSA